MTVNVRFHFLEKFSLRDRTRLKRFIAGIFQREGRKLDSLSIIFCSDDYLLAINRDFLQHDYFTDIITFDLADADGRHAEIYISVERVRDNAQQLGVSFRDELHRVLFHGALHLCGFKDKRSSERAVMRSMEDKYLSKYLNI